MLIVMAGHFGVRMAGLEAQNIVGDRAPDIGVIEIPEAVKEDIPLVPSNLAQEQG
jgi:hypothetical protein